jgi:hypothetical protein
MSMIAIHSAALHSKIASYHEFLARYSKHRRVVYGFVEGKEDPSFYRGFIELLLPDEWQLELWPAGNKDQVYQIHKLINWRRFPKKRICFFVDRDLSLMIPDKIIQDTNIFVTSGYSIENDVVKEDTCKRVLTELFGFSSVDHDELDNVGMLFEQELERFCRCLIPIMAWIVAWKRNGRKPGLSDILMRDLFAFSGTSIQSLPNPKGKADLTVYIHQQCNIAMDPSIDITSAVKQFSVRNRHRSFARGKYLFWFLIEFCRSVHKNAPTIFPSISNIPKVNVTISQSNAMAVVGPRARMPQSLRKFLAGTFLSYIGRVDSLQKT